MPLVTVDLNPGRSKERKQQMVEAITDIMVDIGGASRDHCWVIFREVAYEDWGIQGHLTSSEHFAQQRKSYEERVKQPTKR